MSKVSDWFWNSEPGQTITETEKSMKMWAYVQIVLLAVIAVVSTIGLFLKRGK